MDERNELLQSPGLSQPTLISLKFLSMVDSQKILHLSSLDSKTEFSSNLPCNFTSILNSPIDWGEERWDCALSSIIYPKNIQSHFPQWSNVLEKEYEYNLSVEIFTWNFQTNRKELLHSSVITFEEQILKEKNSFVNYFLQQLRKLFDHVSIATEQLVIRHRTYFELDASTGLLRAMGYEFKNLEPKRGKTLAKPRPDPLDDNISLMEVPFKYSYKSIYPESLAVYCNIISPVSWGKKKFQILKVFPFGERSEEGNSYNKYISKHLDFIPIIKPIIENNNISLRSMWGQDIKFRKGNNEEVMVNLIFRRRQ